MTAGRKPLCFEPLPKNKEPHQGARTDALFSDAHHAASAGDLDLHALERKTYRRLNTVAGGTWACAVPFYATTQCQGTRRGPFPGSLRDRQQHQTSA